MHLNVSTVDQDDPSWTISARNFSKVQSCKYLNDVDELTIPTIKFFFEFEEDLRQLS